MNRLCQYLLSHVRSYLPSSFLSSLSSSSSNTQPPGYIRSQRGFTLVELIVVITILAILSAIGFLVMSNYASTARDGKRISEIKDLASSARINVAQMKKLPIPTSDALTIYVDETGDLGGTGAFVGYQGFLNSALSQDFGYNVDNTLDPVDKTPYTYRVNQLRNKSQFLAFLENPRFQRTVTLVQAPSIHLFTPALSSTHLSNLTKILGIDSVEALDVDTSIFASKYPYAIGDPLGILLDKATRSPLQSGVSGINPLTLDPNSDSLYTLVLDEGTTSAALSSGTLLSMRNGTLEEKIRLAQFTLSSDTGGTTPPPDPGDPTCGLTSQEVSEMNIPFETINGYTMTDVEWCALTNLNITSQPVNTIALGGIMKLVNLNDLILEDTGLTSLPSTIGNLTQLNYLNLNTNDLTSLPESIGTLTNLSSLHLAWNANLSTLPDSIGDLTILEQMDLDGTNLGNLIGYYESNSTNSTTTQANITTTGQEVHIITHDDDYIQIIVGAMPPPSCGLTPEEVDDLNAVESIPGWGEVSGNPRSGEEWCDTIALEWPGKGLTSLPIALQKLTQIEDIDLSSNNFTVLPNWIGMLSGVTSMRLEYNSLSSLPSSIANLTNLTSLDLDDNAFSSFPNEIINLPQLGNLSINDNSLIGTIPPGIGNLINLTSLEFRDNQITGLPDEIGNLVNLNRFIINNNQIPSLPETMSGMTSLISINASSNNITNIPLDIGNLTNLQEMYLNNNQITNLPSSIGNLNTLYFLYLQDNQISLIPSEIDGLTQILEMSFANNQISGIPESIGNLIHVYYLDFANNLLTKLPDSIGSLHVQLQVFNLSGNPALGNLNYGFFLGGPSITRTQTNVTPLGHTVRIQRSIYNTTFSIIIDPEW